MEPTQPVVTPPIGGANGDSPGGEKPKEPAHPSIPQDQWQKLKEEATAQAMKEAEQKLSKKFSEAFKLEENKDGGKTDPILALQDRFASLEETSARKDCEAAHPELRNDKYQKDWSKLCEEKKHLIRSGDLTHEDLYFRIIGQLGAPKSEEKKPSSSIPMFSKGAPPASVTGVTQKEREFYKTKGFTSDEQWLKFTGKEV